MHARVPVSMLLLLSSSWVMAASDPTACNQLGREVALRAAEQLPAAGLDAAARGELAAIAEAVCVDYTRPAGEGGVSAAPGPTAPPAELPTPDGAEASQGQRNVFGLDIIPPEERVRRPGLKRP